MNTWKRSNKKKSPESVWMPGGLTKYPWSSLFIFGSVLLLIWLFFSSPSMLLTVFEYTLLGIIILCAIPAFIWGIVVMIAFKLTALNFLRNLFLHIKKSWVECGGFQNLILEVGRELQEARLRGGSIWSFLVLGFIFVMVLSMTFSWAMLPLPNPFF